MNSITLGDYSFYYSMNTIIESILNNNDNNEIDCPYLKSINLGLFSLFGEWGNESCSLIMNSIIYLFIFIMNRSS